MFLLLFFGATKTNSSRIGITIYTRSENLYLGVRPSSYCVVSCDLGPLAHGALFSVIYRERRDIRGHAIYASEGCPKYH